jgi:hypothetical protein
MSSGTNSAEQGSIQREDGTTIAYIIDRASHTAVVSAADRGLVTIDLKSIANYTGLTSQIIEYINNTMLPVSQKKDSPSDKQENKAAANSDKDRHDCECGKWCMCSQCSCGS